MEGLDRPLSSPGILNDWNPRIPNWTSSFSTVFSILPPGSSPPHYLPRETLPVTSIPRDSSLLPTQFRLAQITEMIHVASLLHDDVLDASPMRRASPSAPHAFGNKASILAGDFLLGRANASLARLGSGEVTELMSCVLCNLVEGEVMQLRETEGASRSSSSSPSSDGDGEMEMKPGDPQVWTTYLSKSYFKTASLLARSIRSAVVLGGALPNVLADELLKDVAYAYGRNLGIAFQVRSSSPLLPSI